MSTTKISVEIPLSKISKKNIIYDVLVLVKANRTYPITCSNIEGIP
jgi:hypothetical protein